MTTGGGGGGGGGDDGKNPIDTYLRQFVLIFSRFREED